MSFDDARKVTEDRLRQLAPAIARALGPGWKATEKHRHHIELTGPEGISVGLSATYPNAAKGRIVARGVLPYLTRHNESVSTYGIENPEITVAVARGAEQIAAEVARRLLPGYRTVLATMRERVASAEAHRDAVTSTAARLADLAGASAPDQHGRFYLPDALASYGTVTSQGDRVRIEGTFTGAQAEAVIRTLVALAKRGGK